MLGAEDVQDVLVKLGYADNVGGDLSTNAWMTVIKIFQSDMGLGIDGVVGPKTDVELRRFQSALDQAPDGFTRTNRWMLTNYCVPSQKDYLPGNVPIYDPKGNIIAQVSPLFFIKASLEGTARMNDGSLINVTSMFISPKNAHDYDAVYNIAQQHGWIPSKPGYAGIHVSGNTVSQVMTFSVLPSNKVGKGYGLAHGMPLDPFRSVAADLGLEPRSDPTYKGKGGVVPVGTKIWCPDLFGLSLPDNTVHDGFLVVNDTGGGINGAHFDVFVGERSWGQWLDKVLAEKGHIWFDGIEKKLDRLYVYGLNGA